VADRAIKIYLVVEDPAHESIARALLRRLSSEGSVRISVGTTIRGGHGGVITEIKGFQRALKKGAIPSGTPDLLVVFIDANCHDFQDIKREAAGVIDGSIFPFYVIGCPDPHIEKWLLLDQNALKDVFGVSPNIPLHKCERDFYKNELKNIIRNAGWPITQGGIEYSKDIIEKIDFIRAKRNDASFGNFINDLRLILKNIIISFQS
jgi:hypothetical protein